MLAFFSLLEISRLMLAEVFAELPDYGRAKKAARAVFKLIDRKPFIDSMGEDGIKGEKLLGDIEFRSVDFCYPTRPGFPGKNKRLFKRN